MKKNYEIRQARGNDFTKKITKLEKKQTEKVKKSKVLVTKFKTL